MSQPYDFTILTDSSADLGEDLVREMDIQVLPLSFTIQDRTYHNYPDNHELSPHTFYKMLREGQTATTAAVNVEQYLQALEPQLQAGRDVLVLAFSSGLSATYNSSAVAADELREKYPERKIYTVDTLCASLGQGLLVWLAAKERAKGKTIDEVRDWAVGHKLSILQTVAVADEHGLVSQVDGRLFHPVHQGFQGGPAAPGLGHGHQLAVVIHMEHRLDLEHRAHKGGGGGDTAPPL